MNIFISVLIGVIFANLTGNIFLGGIVAVMFVIPMSLQSKTK